VDSRAWPGGPKLAISATLAPLDTERHFLLVHMNIRHAGWTEEQVQACGETPSVPAGATDVELAQLAAYDAFQARFEGREAVEEAAQRALELDPNCADAYTVLWLMEWEDSPQALQLVLQANMASLAILGDRPPDFGPGEDLWTDFLYRPIVRAYAALSLTLWAHERREQAIETAREVLMINPGDNLGMRWHLQNWYLTLGRVRPARQLLRQFAGEPWAAAAYALALAEFAHEGPSTKARKALARAQEINPLTFRLLASSVEAIDPPGVWDYYCAGSWEEAMQWHAVVRPAWEAIPGALEWHLQMRRQPDFVRRDKEEIARLAVERAEEKHMSLADVLYELALLEPENDRL
jgi:tetratricopeptide (TPR) repeat protein